MKVIILSKTSNKRKSSSLTSLILGRPVEPSIGEELTTKLPDFNTVRSGIYELKIASIHVEVKETFNEFLSIGSNYVLSEFINSSHEIERLPTILATFQGNSKIW